MNSVQAIPTIGVFTPRKTVQDLYKNLGDAIAAVLEDPDCPDLLRLRLYELVTDISNDAERANSVRKAATDARLVFPVCCEIISAES